MNRPAPTDPFEDGLRLNDEGMDLRERFQATGSDADLDAAIETVRRAAALIGAAEQGGTAHGTVLSNLGSMLATKAARAGLRPLLDEGIGHLRRALTCTAGSAHDRGSRYANLGQALIFRAASDGDQDTLAEGLHALRTALDAFDPADPARASAASAYAMGLRVQSEMSGVPVPPATDVADPYAVPPTLAEGSDPDQVAAVLANLALARGQSADPAGRDGVIADALDLAAQAVRAMPPGRADSAITTSHLLTIALRHHQQTGRLAELDLAVALGHELLDHLPEGLRPPLLANMALALDTRARRTASLPDAVRAVALVERAARTASAGTPYVAAAIALDHAVCLQGRGRLSGDHRDTRRARLILERVLRTAPTATLRGYAAMDLAALHLSRAEIAAELARSTDRTPAAGAVGWVRSRAERIVLRATAWASTQGDVELAVRYGRRAVAELPATGDGYGNALLNLARAHAARWRRDAATADLDRATDSYRQVTDLAGEPPLRRIMAGQEWGDLAAEAGSWPSAHQGYRRAVLLLPEFATWRADRRDHEFVLGMVSGLARDAAAAALHAGDPQDALVLAELGRGIMLDHVMSYHRELDELTRTAPVVARELRETLSALHEDGMAGPARTDDQATEPGGSGARLVQSLTGRRELVDRLARLLDEIRALPGFARFALPPRLAELQAEAADGPVVLVNVSRHRCDALVVTVDEVVHVPLPELRHADVTARAGQLVTATGDGDEEVMREILRWLWWSTVGPVLTRLGRTGTATGGRPARVWWVPTGLLASLPLHAATDGDHGALDAVVSSIVPTIRSLGYCRRTPTVALPRRLCLVLPGPGATDGSRLPAARREVADLRERFGAQRTDLVGAQVGATEVLATLPGHAWAHFACHARSDLADPSASRLLLSSSADGALTVDRLVRLRADGGELAFLSACETAVSGPDLADEAVHLAAGFLTAGFGQVVATLWAVKDPVARRTTDDVYATLLAERAASAPVGAADALHRAALAARTRYPDAPTAWASYVHLGR